MNKPRTLDDFGGDISRAHEIMMEEIRPFMRSCGESILKRGDLSPNPDKIPASDLQFDENNNPFLATVTLSTPYSLGAVKRDQPMLYNFLTRSFGTTHEAYDKPVTDEDLISGLTFLASHGTWYLTFSITKPDGSERDIYLAIQDNASFLSQNRDYYLICGWSNRGTNAPDYSKNISMIREIDSLENMLNDVDAMAQAEDLLRKLLAK